MDNSGRMSKNGGRGNDEEEEEEAVQEVVGTSRVEARGKNGRESNKVEDGWGQESWKGQRNPRGEGKRREATRWCVVGAYSDYRE